MLGWMLKRGVNTVPEAEDADNTLAEQPDTPAPVFAARAFNRAIFGTPAVNREKQQTKQDTIEPTKTEATRTPPPKPQGILLTPGTATLRQKRVSFGRDIGAKKPKSSSSSLATRQAQLAAYKDSPPDGQQKNKEKGTEAGRDSDDEWEEDIEDEGIQCGHDVTVDLNEPNSQSGKYWKDEFAKYHNDAKAEMEKLLQYKQLAKSYAQQKDAEAVELARMLKEEQQKVIKMEKKIAQNASHIMSQHQSNPEDASPELVEKLAKQTALAVQYRQRVQELEGQLQLGPDEADGNSEFKGRRRTLASPNTQRTLLDAQRELRRARAQAKEMTGLREQVSSLKQQLRAAGKHRADPAQQIGGAETASLRDLRKQLREAQRESEKKGREIEEVRKAFEAFRSESEAKEENTRAVMDRLQAKMAELRRELRHAKAAAPKEASRSTSPNEPPVVKSDQRLRDAEEAKIETGLQHRPQAPRTQRQGQGLDDAEVLTEIGITGVEAPKGASRTLRQKFKEDTVSERAPTLEAMLQPRMSGALGERPDLRATKWQPFVPRSPRNRAYMSQELQSRISNGGVTPSATRQTSMDTPDLPALARSISLSGRTRSRRTGDQEADVIQNQLVRTEEIIGEDQSQATWPTRAPRGGKPSERRAAAEARIQQRRAEKQKLRAGNGADKENIMP